MLRLTLNPGLELTGFRTTRACLQGGRVTLASGLTLAGGKKNSPGLQAKFHRAELLTQHVHRSPLLTIRIKHICVVIVEEEGIVQ